MSALDAERARRQPMTPGELADAVRSAIGHGFGEFEPLDSPRMSPAARLARLDALDDVLASGRAKVADARALVVAGLVRSTSTRQAAADLGLSPSAVAKAVARVRALT